WGTVFAEASITMTGDDMPRARGGVADLGRLASETALFTGVLHNSKSAKAGGLGGLVAGWPAGVQFKGQADPRNGARRAGWHQPCVCARAMQSIFRVAGARTI